MTKRQTYPEDDIKKFLNIKTRVGFLLDIFIRPFGEPGEHDILRPRT